MTAIDYPRRASCTSVEDDVDGLVVQDLHTGSRHRLNGVAQHIWGRCDGTRDRAALARDVAVRFGIADADAARDVDAALTQFGDAGLIVTEGATARECTLLMWAVGAAIGTRTGRPPGGLADVRWNALVRLAVEHRVTPLLYRCVSDQWQSDVPAIVRQQLESQWAANEITAHGAIAEVIDVLHELRANDISAVPLKGPVLAHWLYGSAAMRQVGDLDVFVSPEDADRATEILRRRGYVFHTRRGTDALAVRQCGHREICIDLQWALARSVFRFPLTLDTLWKRLTTIDILGTAVAQPRPDDYLLLLCAHATKHCWNSLVWVADIAALLAARGSSVDWGRLLSSAAQAGGERQLLLGLRLARDLLGAPLPAPVSQRLAAYRPLEPLVAQVRRTLLARSGERTFQGSLGVTRGGIFYMRTRERLRDRLPYVGYLAQQSLLALVERATPNHHDRAIVHLPRRFAFLYYVVRLVRVTLKWRALKAIRERRLPRLRPANR